MRIEEVINNFKSIADGFLLNNRDIISRYDDSVSSIKDGKEIHLRRARGYAPTLISLHFDCKENILALGGHLKNTICLGRGEQAIMSQHLGDLDNTNSADNFHEVLTLYRKMFNFRPEVVVRDLHPDYYSSLKAEDMVKELGIESISVQHHHAHIAACMTEHHLKGPVIGVAFDGLGMGNDETLWGGEFLFCQYNSFERLAHFKPVPMPGGSLAIKDTWRMMLGFLHTFKAHNKKKLAPFIERVENSHGKKTIELIEKQTSNLFNSPLTSSCGRIFDAVSALLGVCLKQEYEGQAPVELETLAHAYENQKVEIYRYELLEKEKPYQISTEPIFLQIADDMKAELPKEIISYKFHQTLKAVIVDLCHKIRSETQCSTICLAGGVFQNQLLSGLVEQELIKSGFSVYSSCAIPTNDGGLSLGQIAIAAHLI